MSALLGILEHKRQHTKVTVALKTATTTSYDDDTTIMQRYDDDDEADDTTIMQRYNNDATVIHFLDWQPVDDDLCTYLAAMAAARST